MLLSRVVRRVTQIVPHALLLAPVSGAVGLDTVSAIYVFASLLIGRTYVRNRGALRYGILDALVTGITYNLLLACVGSF
jgi:hypothetical protein